MKRFVLVIASAWIAACGSSPTSPSSSTPPTPTPTTWTLSGHVTSTAGGAIGGARVTIQDGPNATRSTTTDSSGAYTLASLTSSGFTVGFSATNYFGVSLPANLVSNVTLDAQLVPTPLFIRSGVGNNVFDMPLTVSRVHIVGTYTGYSSNFIVTIGGRLVVNDLIGTGWQSTVSDGVYQTTGGTVAITNSSGVSWTFTEVRP